MATHFIFDYIVLVLSLILLATWRAIRYIESLGYWTLRLRLALMEPYLLTSWVLILSSVLVPWLWAVYGGLMASLSLSDAQLRFLKSCFLLVVGAGLVWVLEFSYKNLKSLPYLHLRWKAWSGPSRTGFPAGMAQYIGDREDWRRLAQASFKIEYHTIDRFSGSVGWWNDYIPFDPTALLRARAQLDKGLGFKWHPQTEVKEGVYQPTSNNSSVSLLWGEELGFQRRCSRGIIAVPPYLLATSPTLKSGLPGQALCLAYAVLSRNKGLEPRSLICNLKKNSSYRQWEEAGIWPHPTKTLRSFYYSELDGAFSLLGESYVTAATELALLLADLNYKLVEYWLNRKFEHQDLEFNHLVHAHGGNDSDLDRLYRGHYAAMLISLNLVSSHPTVRPELAVFEAVCDLDRVPIPEWALSPAMQARREAELDAYGPSLSRVVQALI